MNGTSVIARYSPSEVEEYAGNPFIEALPKIMEQKEIIGSLRSLNEIDEKAIQKSKEVRVHNICRLSNSYFQPLSAHIELSRKISLMIRGGYVGRNPKQGDFKKQLQNGYERIQTGDLSSFKFDDVSSTAQSMAFIGCSGCGKTTTLNRILFTYPSVIYHEDQNLEQVVYLRIDCSHNGSLKEICLNFFRALDRAIGSDYELKYGLKRHSIESMLARMSQLANSHALGLLVIDEIQHLIKSKAEVTEAMMNFFVTLVNTIGIPVVMVGTPRAQPLFNAQLRSGRRAVGLGAVYWEPFDPSKNDKNSKEWKGFTDNLWKLQYLQKRDVVLSDEIRDAWYDLSQGVTDIVVKLFILSQLRAILTGQERITVGLLQQVYQDELKPVHPMLEALRSKIPERIAVYSDLMVPGMERRLFQISQQILEAPSMTSEDKALDRLSTDDEKKIFLTLSSDYAHDELVKVIQEVMFKDKNQKYPSGLAKVIEILECYEATKVSTIDKKQAKNTFIREKDWPGLENSDLRFISSQNNSSDELHDTLKKGDMMLNLSDLLGKAR